MFIYEHILSKKFTETGLSKTKAGYFNPGFCYASQIFSTAQDF